jgi:uncharacterized small protein (DUF1192 family)
MEQLMDRIQLLEGEIETLKRSLKDAGAVRSE